LGVRGLEILIAPHTLRQARRRGVTAEEIEEVIRTGDLIPAKRGRLARFKVFPCLQPWQGNEYPQKRVEVVYVTEKGVIITVTVYAFYGRFEDGA
jgi:hypothetical protein